MTAKGIGGARALGVCLLMSLVLLACAPPTGSPGPAPGSLPPAQPSVQLSPEVQRLIAAAAAAGETELNLSWSESSLGGVEGSRRYIELFNRMYGTNVRVNFTPGPSMTDMSGRVAQEYAAGRKSSSDVLLGTEGHYTPLMGQGVLEEYDYTLLSPRIAPGLVAYGNVGVELYNTTAAIAYNTDLVSPAEAPRRLEDVLNPKWRGKIASTTNIAYLDNVAFRPEWGPDRMKSFMTRLSDQVGGLLRADDVERVVSGEFVMMVLTNSHGVRRNQALGAPVQYVVPEDAAIVKFLYLGVPRNSSHPNLSKLFINTMLSEDGQKILYEVYGVDHYLLAGTRAGNELQELQSRGLQPLEVDIQWAIEHPEMTTLTNELVGILRERRGS